jgi:hypothetical protein
MPKSEHDTLSNPGTSRVFLSLVLGKKNPTAIAEFLGIRPPPVIEQLRRLQKAKLIKLGKKDGKEQNYEIQWKSFLELFIDKAPLENTDEFKNLTQNKYFEKIIYAYLQSLSDTKVAGEDLSLAFSIIIFEKTLRQADFFNQKREFADKEKQEFFDVMRLWRNRILTTQSQVDEKFNSAIKEILED